MTRLTHEQVSTEGDVPELTQDVRCMRRRSLGTAFRADPRREVAPRIKPFWDLAWAVRDISASGAFLETHGPVPIGSIVDLTLVFGATMVHVTVEVVRIQEPGWGRAAGVGVSFIEFGGGAKQFLESYVAAAVTNKS